MLPAILQSQTNFIMDTDLNKQIAQEFFVDSGDYLKRYHTLKEHQTHIGNKSKLLIDLLFSIECSLKALIFLESIVDEKETYKKIKTHDLVTLTNIITSVTLAELKEILKQDLDGISVSARYTLDANIHFRNLSGIFDEFYYSTIGNPAWLDKIYSCASNLHLIVREKLPKISTVNFGEIDIDIAIDYARRYKALGRQKINKPNDPTREKSYSVVKIREKHQQAYMPWKPEDDEKLKLLFDENKTMKELSEIFERDRGAINSRIKNAR